VDEGFLESVVHKRAPFLARARGYSGHVVLGRRLRPFSFWLQQLLLGVDSPFLSVWKIPPSSVDLFENLYLAIEICRVKFPHRPIQTGLRATLRRKLTVFWWYLRLGMGKPRGHRMVRLLIEAAKFRAYVNDYSSGPVHFPSRDKNSRAIQTPVALYQMSLFRKYQPHVSRDECWQMSPGDVGWQTTAAQEADGRAIEIMTEARKQAREAAIKGGKKADALRKSKQQNGNGNGHVRC
jgi:hypothetical protein